MKKTIILLILAIISVNQISAQEKIIIDKKEKNHEIKKGKYYVTSNENLEKFTGQWISEDKKFKILLSIEKAFFKGPDIYMDGLVGRYAYNSEINNKEEFSFKTTSTSGENNEIVNFLFHDKGQNKNGHLQLTILGNDKIKWKLRNTEGIRIGKNNKSFSVPADAILKKLK